MSDQPSAFAAVATVVPFTARHQQAAADLVLHIQNVEAGLAIALDDQPDLADIDGYYSRTGSRFWVALDGHERVVGTIGLLGQTPGIAVLKKFFVAADWRGAGRQCASQLYAALIAFARAQGTREILLDTPARAVRSHAFYRRHGFEPIAREDLPIRYDYPDRDSLLFRLRLA